MSSSKRFSLRRFGHKKKDSSGLDEGLTNLNLGGGGGDQEPVTPARRWSFGRSRSRPTTPKAPVTSHQQQLVRTDPGSQLPRHSPTEILLEHLIQCEPNTKFSARLNKVAEKEGYHQIGWGTTTWETKDLENGKSFEDLFVQAVTRHDIQVNAGKIVGWKPINYFPQVEKLLVLEGDVGDS